MNESFDYDYDYEHRFAEHETELPFATIAPLREPSDARSGFSPSRKDRQGTGFRRVREAVVILIAWTVITYPPIFISRTSIERERPRNDPFAREHRNQRSTTHWGIGSSERASEIGRAHV